MIELLASIGLSVRPAPDPFQGSAGSVTGLAAPDALLQGKFDAQSIVGIQSDLGPDLYIWPGWQFPAENPFSYRQVDPYILHCTGEAMRWMSSVWVKLNAE
jgi:hypothetical protein